MASTERILFVAWQDPKTREWIPVGRLTHANGTYLFQYTKGAKRSERFVPFGWMRALDTTYLSPTLFPLFANRLLPKSRPEFKDYIEWLGLTESKYDELEILARSGGIRETDTLEIFPCPMPDKDNRYVAYFFCHGLRYFSKEQQTRLKTLKVGERLRFLKDIQNSFDPTALMLRTQEPVSLMGYCPRYFSAEFSQLLEKAGPEDVSVTAERVNPDAPSELRLLCKIVAPWPRKFAPCSKGLFEPISKFTPDDSFERKKLLLTPHNQKAAKEKVGT